MYGSSIDVLDQSLELWFW